MNSSETNLDMNGRTLHGGSCHPVSFELSNATGKTMPQAGGGQRISRLHHAILGRLPESKWRAQ